MSIKLVLAIVAGICGMASALINMIRIRADPDPPFAIVEKKETIDPEAKKRIQKMLEDMDKD